MLPAVLPDMSLYSLTACAHRMAGRVRGADTCHALYGHAGAGLWHDFPSHLGEFCRRTGGAYGTPVELVQRTTFLPYFLRFRTASREARILNALQGSGAERLKFLLGLPAGPTGASFPLRACIRCMADDEEKYGVAYWHRRHQLPGVFLCQAHLDCLVQSGLRIDRRRRSVFVLPRDPGIFAPESPGSLPAAAKPVLARLGNLAADVLDHALPTVFSQEQLRAAYFHGLRDRGMLTRSGLVRAQQFLKWIRDAYHVVASYPPYDWILGDSHLSGLMRLLRKPRSEFHTAYHVLLIDALFGTWDRFAAVYEWEKVMDCPVCGADTDSGTETPITPLSPELELLAQRARGEGQSLKPLCAEMAIPFHSAMRQLAKSGAITIPRRPKVLTAERRQQIVAALRRGEPQRDVAIAEGLSKATIDRICTETAGLHAQWRRARVGRRRERERAAMSDFLDQNPAATAGNAREQIGTTYRWLLGHDARWLHCQFPAQRPQHRSSGRPRPRINWEARDRECLRALEGLAQPLVFERGERLQPGSILRKLPKLSFTPRLDRLPLSRALVAELLDQHRDRF